MKQKNLYYSSDEEEAVFRRLRDEHSFSDDLGRVREIRDEIRDRLINLGYSSEFAGQYFDMVDWIRLGRGQDIPYEIGE